MIESDNSNEENSAAIFNLVMSWVVAQTLVISKKVRTRQSFCAYRRQKNRRNIGPGPCSPEKFLKIYIL